MSATRSGPAHLILWGAFTLFALVLVWLIIQSLVPRDAAEFQPTPLGTSTVPDTLFVDTITVDARQAGQWVFVDLERRTAVMPPDTTGWDLAFRRFEIVTSRAAFSSALDFSELTEAPESGYIETTFGTDTTNAAFEDWYRYSFTSHLLNPRPNTYVIRTTAGRYAKLKFLGYYCTGMAAGCVTFRYAYQPDGSRLFRSGR